jgi:hypothetical protein
MGGLAIPLLCDLPLYPTRIRALIAWTTLCIFGNLTMLYGYRFELVREQEPQGWIKFREEGYGPAAALYFAYGMLDALWQGVSTVYSLPISGLRVTRGGGEPG